MAKETQKQKQDQGLFEADKTPTKSLLFGMIVISLFAPVLLVNSILPAVLGNSETSPTLTVAWFVTVLILVANIRFAVALRKRDEERKFLNLVAMGCSLWMALHFATVANGVFGDAVSKSPFNYSVISFAVSLAVALLVSAQKLVSKWRRTSLLYKFSYAFILGLSLFILLYYALHREMFLSAA
jgi:hypothetical protein